MREKNLEPRIREEVISGRVNEPFKSSDFIFLAKSPGFISKHAVGNGKYSKYFIRVSMGLYMLIKNN
jgi:hypothetical protein